MNSDTSIMQAASRQFTLSQKPLETNYWQNNVVLSKLTNVIEQQFFCVLLKRWSE